MLLCPRPCRRTTRSTFESVIHICCSFCYGSSSTYTLTKFTLGLVLPLPSHIHHFSPLESVRLNYPLVGSCSFSTAFGSTHQVPIPTGSHLKIKRRISIESLRIFIDWLRRLKGNSVFHLILSEGYFVFLSCNYIETCTRTLYTSPPVKLLLLSDFFSTFARAHVINFQNTRNHFIFSPLHP